MKKWAIVLHFYQPPGQEPAITQQILRSCYLPLLKLIKSNPQVHLTFNISGCLLEQLNQPFFILVKELVTNGQVELLNSPAFHPVISLVSKQLVTRQIELQTQITKNTLNCKLGSGFFPPELAINPKSLTWLGPKYDYILVDQTAIDQAPYQPVVQYGKTKLLVNCRPVSEVIRSYPGHLSANKITITDHVLITINDAEIFGHHFQERLDLLDQLFHHSDFTFVSASEIAHLSAVPITNLQSSSWQLWHRAKPDNPFALWNNNTLQKSYLRLLRRAEKLVTAYPNSISLSHLDRGSSSCFLYWLSNWPWWHPDLVETGARELIKSIRSLTCPNPDKSKTESLYFAFLKAVWLYHWSGQVEANYQKYDALRVQGSESGRGIEL